MNKVKWKDLKCASNEHQTALNLFQSMCNGTVSYSTKNLIVAYGIAWSWLSFYNNLGCSPDNCLPLKQFGEYIDIFEKQLNSLPPGSIFFCYKPGRMHNKLYFNGLSKFQDLWRLRWDGTLKKPIVDRGICTIIDWDSRPF